MMVVASVFPYIPSSCDSDWRSSVTDIPFSLKIEMYSGKFTILLPVAKSSQRTWTGRGSFGLSFIANTFLTDVLGGLVGTGGGPVSVIPWWLAIGALAFATMVGIVSGWAPARRAMNLSALEGLKNE